MYSIKLCFFFLSTTFITGSLATPLHKHFFHHHHGSNYDHFCTRDGSGDVACSFPNGVETTFFAGSATGVATATPALISASADGVDSTSSVAVASTSTSAEASTTGEALELTSTVTAITTVSVTSPLAVTADSTSISTETSQPTSMATSTSVSAASSENAAAVVSSSASTGATTSTEASTSTAATATTSASVVDSAVAAAVISSSSSTSSSASAEVSTSTSTKTSTTTSASAVTSAQVAAVSASRSTWTSTSTESSQSTSATTPTSASTAASTSASASTVSKSTTTTAASSNTNTATGILPAPSQFGTDNGTKWSVEYVGEIGYTGSLASQSLGGDKCRTSKIGDQIMWNCGDMECGGSYTNCGFSMGPSFPATDDVLTIDTSGTTSMNSNGFLNPWSGDPAPESPWAIWGMDTSNVAAINETHGVTYGWEIWRGAADGSVSNRGNAVGSVTIGDNGPVATRVGPLLTGPDSISLGLLAILSDGGYIYTYTIGGPTNLIIGRVAASDDVFDASQYRFLAAGTDDTWIPGIPSSTDTSVAATTANTSGSFGCGNYGSVFFNSYLNKYVILCDIFMSFVNMYVADNPWGPWSAEYSIQSGGMIEGSYGSMAHPEYAVDGDSSGKSFYYSLGPNGMFNVFKLTFDY
ncbi:hypothetical protein LTR10_021678 [Elasticomyces elasticus]|uniref:DUF4185 domain-containing protein n=1 Tax=Exophiala sideris TaxID=1016849 RepID=A0ABR0IWP2_9EURO|nr:hypothetical protein LTR10_021678 [Elasticomyces elasticus]KAK5021123.1 hypothetical protein LTS07_011210 [Exophiala sideris]KAK5023734.1 hypothetical protein LTR13_011112 [Exophiala sideris]KAK5048813.1 hypothetical protein LTR69_011227 [Exophiala sideris]KAK5176326.1 hypothetical protein LTR44_011157 [Eurotiomycetes sp. CCFEE 6388]